MSPLLPLLLLGCPRAPAPDASSPASTAPPAALTEREVGGRFVIAHTNDMHANLTPTAAGWTEDRAEVGGLLALAAEVRALESLWGEERVLLLDAGDIRSGTPLDEYASEGVEAGAMLTLMEAMGYDAWTLGNHEFDRGFDSVGELVAASDIPVLSANLDVAGGKPAFTGLRESVVLQAGGHRVGVIGLTTPGVARYVLADLASLVIVDPTESARREAALLRDKVDVLVALTHLGLEDDLALASAVPEIDLIVGAHSHTRLEVPKRVGNTWIVQTGCCAQGLGVAIIDPLDDGTISVEYSLVNPDPAGARRRAPADFAQLAGDWERRLDADWGVIVGHNAVGTLGRGEEEHVPLGRWVCESLRMATGADVALYNASGIRADLEGGDIARSDLYNVFPFGNEAVVATVGGGDLIALALRNATAQIDPERGRSIVQDGLTYTWRTRLDTAEIVEVQVNGRPLDPDGVYTVVTNAFVAKQWGRYVGEEPDEWKTTGRLVRDIVEERVAAEGVNSVPAPGGTRTR